MDKLKLMEHTFGKLSHDDTYMAYYLNRLLEAENLTKEELMVIMGCSPGNFYKLSLATAPSSKAADFKERIKNIAAFCSVSEIILVNLILQHNLDTAVPNANNPPSFISECITLLKKVFSPPAVYQPAVTTLLVLLIVIPAFTKGHSTKHLALFEPDYSRYTDSVKHIQIPDNTWVRKNNF